MKLRVEQLEKEVDYFKLRDQEQQNGIENYRERDRSNANDGNAIGFTNTDG